jgi:hypothetical protein
VNNDVLHLNHLPGWFFCDLPRFVDQMAFCSRGSDIFAQKIARPMKIILIILAILGAATMTFFWWVNRTVRVVKETSYGPFTIRATAVTGKTWNLNYGLVNRTAVGYSIWHGGKSVVFPAELEANTGLPFLWKVYTLDGAPEPTLLAGSQSLYLISLKKGVATVEPLFVQAGDFATLQFLDSENGQPGKESEVFSVSQVAGMEKLEPLRNGNLLLVSGHLVVDIRTGQKWLFNKGNSPIDNYSFPSPKGALALSPDRKSIVFHAEFQSWNTENENLPDSEHALVVYDYEKDSGYSVIYDDTETRMTDMFSLNRAWLDNCFEWKKGGDGSERLRLKPHDVPRNWLGKYKERDGYYILYPVKASMHPVFLDFVLKQMGWTKANILTDKFQEYTGRCMELGDAETKLDISFREDEREIHLSKHLYLGSEELDRYRTLVKKIGDAFDAELTAGKHQAHFGKVINETKRIMDE